MLPKLWPFLDIVAVVPCASSRVEHMGNCFLDEHAPPCGSLSCDGRDLVALGQWGSKGHLGGHSDWGVRVRV